MKKLLSGISFHRQYLLPAVITGFIFSPSAVFAQEDYGCDKCSMLREEYELAEGTEKEEIYAYFKQECLDTDTLYTNSEGKNTSEAQAEVINVVAKGKCIDFTEVKQVEKKTGRQIASFQVEKKDTVYVIGTKSPEFPGGDIEIVSYLSKNLHYPEESKYSNKSGTVYLKVVIGKDGKIGKIRTMRTPDKYMAAEAERLIKAMPDWIPGEYKGSKVNMMRVIPVRFSLH